MFWWSFEERKDGETLERESFENGYGGKWRGREGKKELKNRLFEDPTRFTNIQNLCFLLPHGPDWVSGKPDRVSFPAFFLLLFFIFLLFIYLFIYLFFFFFLYPFGPDLVYVN